MEEIILLIISLFFAMALLYLVSKKLNISYPIFLVLGGLAISLIPGIPSVSIEPEIVFLLFLPPLLFEAAWHTSWPSFWRLRTAIFTMGFGVVFFTATTVAFFTAAYIPGFTLALGFLLGGIISPPDAVAATSVLQTMGIPKRGITILEGESLVNDAASLTVYKFALLAIFTGEFVWQHAAWTFFSLAFMGIVFGLVVAHIIYFFLRFVTKDSVATTPLMLIAPYVMYLGAEHFQWSGVLSVVSGGLFLSFRSADFLDYTTRLQSKEVFRTISFLLHGFVFILIGLELPIVMQSIRAYSFTQALEYALIISLVVIVVRIVLVYITTYFLQWIGSKRQIEDYKFGNKLPFVIGWSGMRGVVSLASALAVPLVLSSGNEFPMRDLILFITFVVILVTLVFQGLTLPLLIKLLKIVETAPDLSYEEQKIALRIELSKIAVAHLDSNYAPEMEHYDAVTRIKAQLEESIYASEKAYEDQTQEIWLAKRQLTYTLLLEIIYLRRHNLHLMQRKNLYDHQLIRELEHSLDLEEARLKNSFIK